MNAFIEQLAESLRRDTFVQLVLSSPVRNVEPKVQKLSARPVALGDRRAIQLTRQEAARETHQNLDPSEAVLEIDGLFGTSFRHAHLFTTSADISAKLRASGKLKMSERPPTKTAATTEHNRRKTYLIPEGLPCPFLTEIGVMSPEGRVYAPKYDKFRQINRFLEFIEEIYDALPADGPLRVIDFGCGKSYLTFAIHHLLVSIHGREVELLGVDLKQDVIDHCQEIADRLKCRGLTFQTADVNDITPEGRVDLVVSLHACDTATDVALAKAIGWGAGAILSVPCCHHEFASKMEQSALPAIHAHGILNERFAELTTDAYRAQMLEARGYRAQVVEFIELEHTARNLLIRAVSRRNRKPAPGAQERADALAAQLGVADPTLASLLSDETAP